MRAWLVDQSVAEAEELVGYPLASWRKHRTDGGRHDVELGIVKWKRLSVRLDALDLHAT